MFGLDVLLCGLIRLDLQGLLFYNKDLSIIEKNKK
jgi:hypothetical protein